MTDALACEHREKLLSADRGLELGEPVHHTSLWPWFTGAAAVAAGLLIAIPHLSAVQSQRFETAVASRMIALGDGSHVLLAPHSHLEVAGERLALSGEAYFDIRHDPSRPLVVTAGGVSISDIGTRFDMQNLGSRLRVEVAQGSVAVSAAGLASSLQIEAGHSLTYEASKGHAIVTPVQIADVGGWRVGRLTYSQSPLAVVAADLARYAGITVTADPASGDLQFSGTLTVSNGESAVRDLSQLMGLGLHRDARGGYRLGHRS